MRTKRQELIKWGKVIKEEKREKVGEKVTGEFSDKLGRRNFVFFACPSFHTKEESAGEAD